MRQSKVFKTIIVGNQGVGKSSLILRYMKRQFREEYSVTIGVEFSSKNFTFPIGQATLQLWDTAGQQSFRAIIRNFYRGAVGVVLAFSLSKFQTLQALITWNKDIQQNSSPYIFKVLVGTKSDLFDKRQVSQLQAKEMKQKLGCQFYMQTSSLQSKNIDMLFELMAQGMLKKSANDKNFQSILPKNTMKHNLLRSTIIASRPQQRKKCCIK